jgi:hypothetical protein
MTEKLGNCPYCGNNNCTIETESNLDMMCRVSFHWLIKCGSNPEHKLIVPWISKTWAIKRWNKLKLTKPEAQNG